MSVMRRMVDRTRREVNKRMNIDIVRVSGQYTLNAHIATVLEKYAIDAVIDVGANEGGFGEIMRSIGFKGKIFSFEPINTVFAALAQRAEKDSSWHVFNFALGSRAGKSKINVSNFSQFSSILSATDYGNSWKNMKVGYRQDIELQTLDAVFREWQLGAGHRYLLKMDTQGFHLEVSNGAKAFLPEVCCMLSELSLIPAYEGMPGYLESLSRYNGEGFLVSGFYPVTRDDCLALVEVDCMLVRPEPLVAGRQTTSGGGK